MIHHVLAAALLFAASIASAATPAQKCQSEKNKEAGKYDFCRQKAQAKYATTGDAGARTGALQRCLDKYNAKWPLIESKAGGACPSTGDQAAIQGVTDEHTDNIATALAGGPLQDCPADLATCQATPQGQRLETGQTTCWDAGGGPSMIPCGGTGQDGELQKGLARSFTDNGDGTITDSKTGLTWEKLSDDGSIHDKDDTYSWANAFAVKVATLNSTNFAGHNDWRLPNVNELQSLANYGGPLIPAVFPEFNTGCAASCTVLTCSCTVANLPSPYWSSSTFWGNSTLAWTL